MASGIGGFRTGNFLKSSNPDIQLGGAGRSDLWGDSSLRSIRLAWFENHGALTTGSLLSHLLR